MRLFYGSWSHSSLTEVCWWQENTSTDSQTCRLAEDAEQVLYSQLHDVAREW